MDGDLELRYWHLLNSYDAQNRVMLERIKQQLLDHTFTRSVERRPFFRPQAPWLRPDAALCLLTLYDYMITRPYAASTFSAGYPLNFPPPIYNEGSRDFQQKVDLSLDTIFDSLLRRDMDEPRSSHDILRAIDAVWPMQAKIFGWG